MTTSSVDFSSLLAELESERALAETIRESSKELDKAYRSLASILNRVHSTPSSQIPTIIQATLPHFAHCRSSISAIVQLVPPHQYYKWCDDWSFHLKNTVFAVCLTYFLGTGFLLSKEEVCLVLSIDRSHADRFQLSTEEYLHSLVSMINELSRLAVNSVTLGDFSTPVRLSRFVKDLHAGFQLLNLKNDSLRKRFDGIKYDIKKIEEIVYDISLRGLVKDVEGQEAGVGVEVGEEKRQEVLALLMGR
ncbi:Translin [Violaceomyces palustris]|uniref:Translin n=1 Tax=Violaceomyces palustris TaxID=1673888 RepID=A0ACD0P8D9_9BASI|nr:Translin [Violaceomyces palustris]